MPPPDENDMDVFGPHRRAGAAEVGGGDGQEIFGDADDFDGFGSFPQHPEHPDETVGGNASHGRGCGLGAGGRGLGLRMRLGI